MPDHLSIIVTHHQTPELLNLCIKSIRDTAKDVDYKIIVVDSESRKNIEIPGVQVICFKKNLGYSKIVNAGLKKVRGDYILILNADIIVLNNAISEMLKFMKENPNGWSNLTVEVKES